MSEKYEIKLPRGYEAKTQSQIGLFAAQLDDQLKWLKDVAKDLTVKQLEWQERPGMNTVGMLLAHLALVEVWWIKVAPSGASWEVEGKKMVQKLCGFEDDGIPVPADGKHPRFLKSYTAEKYLAIIAKVRRACHRELKSWRDRDLDKLYYLGKEKHAFSRRWTLYHVSEHFAAHVGQINLLKHMMRDAGVLRVKKK